MLIPLIFTSIPYLFRANADSAAEVGCLSRHVRLLPRYLAGPSFAFCVLRGRLRKRKKSYAKPVAAAVAA